jgi:hypothetical protein
MVTKTLQAEPIDKQQKQVYNIGTDKREELKQ